MDQVALSTTRRSLHGVAELVLAGPQYAACRDIRLRATPGGFGTVGTPDLRIVGDRLVGPGVEVPLTGTYAELAAAAHVVHRDLRDVYAVGPQVTADDAVEVDPEAALVLLAAFADGDAALAAFAPEEDRVLWPEHFDLGITVAEVNYGVSPGDAHLGVPYAYVGPWQPRTGTFWNTSFGAAVPLAELGAARDVEAFFREGAARAEQDAVAGT